MDDNIIDFVCADNVLPRLTVNKEDTRKRTNNSAFSSKEKKIPRINPNESKYQKVNKYLSELDIKNACLKSKVIYIRPEVGESSDDRIKRITSLKRKVYEKERYNKTKVKVVKVQETDVARLCKESNIPYIPSYEGETVDDQLQRHRGLKRRASNKNYNAKRADKNSSYVHVHPNQTIENQIFSMHHMIINQHMLSCSPGNLIRMVYVACAKKIGTIERKKTIPYQQSFLVILAMMKTLDLSIIQYDTITCISFQYHHFFKIYLLLKWL